MAVSLYMEGPPPKQPKLPLQVAEGGTERYVLSKVAIQIHVAYGLRYLVDAPTGGGFLRSCTTQEQLMPKEVPGLLKLYSSWLPT